MGQKQAKHYTDPAIIHCDITDINDACRRRFACRKNNKRQEFQPYSNHLSAALFLFDKFY